MGNSKIQSDLHLIINVQALNSEISNLSELDFDGELFCVDDRRIGSPFHFYKREAQMINCVIRNNQLHVFIDNNSLGYGRLFCKLTMYIKDSDFADGNRKIEAETEIGYLGAAGLDTRNEAITVQLPVIVQREVEYIDDGNSGQSQTWNNAVDYRFSYKWLEPTVCLGCIPSGAFAGNIYHNKGAVKMSEKIYRGQEGERVYNLKEIVKLFGHSIEDIDFINGLLNRFFYIDRNGDKIPIRAEVDYSEGKITTEYINRGLGNLYISTDNGDKAYVYKDANGCLRYIDKSPIPEYHLLPPTIEWFSRFIEITQHGEKYQQRLSLDFHIFKRKYNIQVLAKVRRAKRTQTEENDKRWATYKENQHYRWKRVCKFKDKKIYVAPIFFRIARKKGKAMSDWAYFKIVIYEDRKFISIIETDETGSRNGKEIILKQM